MNDINEKLNNSFNKIDKIRGLQITISTNAKDDQKAKMLLEELGMPFAKEDK